MEFVIFVFCLTALFAIPYEIHRENKLKRQKEITKQRFLQDELLRKELELKQAQIDYYKTHSSQENDTF